MMVSRRWKICLLLSILVLIGTYTVHIRFQLSQTSRSRSMHIRPKIITNFTLYHDDATGIIIQDGTSSVSIEAMRKVISNRQSDEDETKDEDEECIPIAPNVDKLYPSCNQMHEFDLSTDLVLLGSGGIRDTWMITSYGSGQEEKMVVKTLKAEFLKSDNAVPEWDREGSILEAVAMTELTHSPHIMNMYGYCGESVFNEFGGQNALDYLHHTKLTSMEKLIFAKDSAQAVADVHSITFCHKDLRPENFLVVNGVVKLNDFNRGQYLRWNVKDGKACGVKFRHCDRMLSPEECTGNFLLTEKEDVYQLGNFLYYILTQLKTPYGWYPDIFYVPLIQNHPQMLQPKHHLLYKMFELSTDPAIIAIREAMKKCHLYDPKVRSSAQEVANDLAYAIKELEQRGRI